MCDIDRTSIKILPIGKGHAIVFGVQGVTVFEFTVVQPLWCILHASREPVKAYAYWVAVCVCDERTDLC